MKVSKVLVRQDPNKQWWWTIKYYKQGWTGMFHGRKRIKVYVLDEVTIDSMMFNAKRECSKEANIVKQYLEGLK